MHTMRDRLRGLSRKALLTALVAARPGQLIDPDDADIMFALQAPAQRHCDLAEVIAAPTERLQARADAAHPGLITIKGVGPVVGAQLLITAGDNPDRLRSSAPFAALCGTAPIPVSAGRTDRYRLSPGGDRAAIAALHHIVKVRMTDDLATAYREWLRADRQPRGASKPAPQNGHGDPNLSAVSGTGRTTMKLSVPPGTIGTCLRTHSMRSLPPLLPGSGKSSPSPPLLNKEPGRPSRPETTHWSSPRQAQARLWQRSSGLSTG